MRSWTLSIPTTDGCQAVLCIMAVLAFPWFKVIAWAIILGIITMMVVMLHRL